MFDLSEKVAVITGSTRGIGRAIAEQMALHGAKVVVSSRKSAMCEEAAVEINTMIKTGTGRAVAIPCNVSHKEELENLVRQTYQHFEKIDILVCNAATNVYYGSMADIPDEAFDKTFTTNLKATHWLCQLVLPDMAKRESGSVIVISSIGGLRGSPTIGTYGVTKAAELALVRNIAVEFGPSNIRANAIAPGLIKTHFSRALWENEEFLKNRLKQTPLRRIGIPDEIAGAAVFLASEAAGFMTGQTLIIDGGVTA
jgi:NAD(P)-dependent dehydrogenase (short-subunit alcohol dehydrogenase family)